MRISHGTRAKHWHAYNGYGYATDMMLESLRTLGYEVTQNDPEADVEIWFDQPHHWKWSGDQYRIGYHPWESTDMRKDWKVAMNNTDEIWTPSPVVAQWYRECGIKRPVHVYQHGIDHNAWKSKVRTKDDKLRFLHVGGEAARKGGSIVLDAFRIAFPNQDDVSLTLKMNQSGWNIPKYGKVSILPNLLELPELVQLYHDHHVFVYPSWGEGFGLNPLQAMATGMPTICTAAWAPYRKFIDQDLQIGSELIQSPWDDLHPGNMFKPDLEDIVKAMRRVYFDYERYRDSAVQMAPLIHREYDWNNLTEAAFLGLKSRINIS